MLKLFKRHTLECKRHFAVDGVPVDKGRNYRRCPCPYHVEGMLGGVMIRRALQTNALTKAESMVRDHEAKGEWNEEQEVEAPARITIAEAVRVFLSSVCPKSTGRS